MSKNIDYSALRRFKKYPQASPIMIVLGIIVGILVFGIAALIDKDWGVGLALAAFIAAGWFAVNAEVAVDEKNNKKLAQFAEDNNFEFVDWNKTIKEPGTVYDHGHSKQETRIISGKFADLAMKLSDYSYTIGSGKNSTDYTVRVLRLTLPHRLPHMVIDCLIDTGGSRSALPIVFDNSQKLELEGDFYKYFTLYAPDKYAISALTVIAPDAMEALMKMKALCDIEIIEDKIYFYWPRADIETYQTIFETVDAVMREVGRKLTNGNIFATKSQKHIHTAPSLKSATLKKGNFFDRMTVKSLIGLSIICYALIVYASTFLSIMTSSPWIFDAGSKLAPLLLIGGAFLYISQRRKKHTLKKELEERFK